MQVDRVADLCPRVETADDLIFGEIHGDAVVTALTLREEGRSISGDALDNNNNNLMEVYIFE